MFGSRRRREAVTLEWWMATFSTLGLWLIHVAFAAAGILIFWKILPKFVSLVQKLELELPSQFQKIAEMASLAKEYWWIILAAAVVDFIVLYIFTQFWLLRWLKRLWFWIITLALVACLIWIITGIFITSSSVITHLIDQMPDQVAPVDPVEPVEPVEPVDDPAEPTDDPAEPTDDPADPTDDPADPTDEPADTTDEPADPADPTDEPADTTDEPAETTDESTDTTDEPDDTAEETTE